MVAVGGALKVIFRLLVSTRLTIMVIELSKLFLDNL